MISITASNSGNIICSCVSAPKETISRAVTVNFCYYVYKKCYSISLVIVVSDLICLDFISSSRKQSSPQPPANRKRSKVISDRTLALRPQQLCWASGFITAATKDRFLKHHSHNLHDNKYFVTHVEFISSLSQRPRLPDSTIKAR